MKNAFRITALAGLFSLAGVANAADGGLCFGPVQVTNAPAGFGTVVYPQIDNATKFTCASGGQFTIKQLSQGGWIIANMVPVAIDITTTSSGTSTSRSRWQITIQR